MPRKRVGLKVFTGIVIAAVLSYAIFAFVARQSINHQIVLAQKEGLWTTPAEILKRPRPPANQNAASIYQPLCKIFEAGSDKRRALAASAEKAGSEPEFEAAYKGAQPFLDEFEKGAAMPQCQFQRDWEQGAQLLFPEFSQLKNAYSLVCTEAKFLSRNGHPAEALDLLRKFAPMAHQTGNDPILISGLVQLSMDSIAFRTLQEILGAHGREPGIPEKANEVLDALGTPPDAALALNGESAMLLQDLNSPSDLAGFFGDDKRLAMMARVPAVRDVWKADILRLARSYHAALMANPNHPKAIMDSFTAIDRGKENTVVMQSLFGLGGGWYTSYAMDESRRKVIRALVAGLESWEKTGHAPTSLPSGISATDPINDQPLHFAQIPGGFKVWGVDRDGVNHGGTPFDPKKEENMLQSDILYMYPWKPPVVQEKPKVLAPPPSPPSRVQSQIETAQPTKAAFDAEKRHAK